MKANWQVATVSGFKNKTKKSRQEKIKIFYIFCCVSLFSGY
jgi:hypothetical protein